MDIPGCLYTVCSDVYLLTFFVLSLSCPHFSYLYDFKVNPIAVNSKYCNVFTENKRVAALISTADFGKVCHFKHFPRDFLVVVEINLYLKSDFHL